MCCLNSKYLLLRCEWESGYGDTAGKAVSLIDYDLEGKPHACNPESSECFLLLTAEEREGIRKKIATWISQYEREQS